MNTTRQILDVIIQAQSKSVENLMEASKNLTASFGKADTLEQALGMYKEWFSKQEAITKELAAAIKDQVITDKTPAFIKEWMETQEKFSGEWVNAIQEMSKNFSGGKVLDFYQGGADQMFAVWKKAYDQFAGMFTTTFGLVNYDPATQAKEMHDKFVESARNFIQMLESEQAKKAAK